MDSYDCKNCLYFNEDYCEAYNMLAEEVEICEKKDSE